MKEKQALLIMWMGILFFTVVPLIRISYDALPPGDIPYHHLSIAGQYLSKGIFSSVNEYPLTPFHLVVAMVLALSSYAGFILPFILFSSSYVLFYFILKEIGISARLRAVTMLLLASSPISVFASSSLVQEGFGIFLIIAGFFLFFRAPLWSIPFFSLALWQSAFNLVVIAVLFVYCYYRGYQVPKPLILVMLFFALFVHQLSFDPYTETSSLVTDFGATVGIGIFSAVLLVIAIHQFWKQKYANLDKYILLVIALSGWMLLGSSMAFYANFYLAYLAAYGSLSVWDVKWESALIKHFTVLVLVCGLFFSFLSYANRAGHELPNSSIMEGLDWLAQNTPPESIVFALPSRGFWMEYSKRLSFATPYNPRDSEVNTILYSRNLARTIELLQDGGIKYIWIDKEMRSSVWSKEDEGLLFLFNNKEVFRKVYDEKGVEIWKVLQ